MKIIGMEITPITLEWKKTIGESFGEVGKREDDVILQIFTDTGLTGIGEAMTLGPYYGRESQGTVMAIMAEHFWPKVLQGADPFNIDFIHYRMDKTVSENSFAKTAVDVALHDIVGKALNVPVCKLIGGSYTDKIPLHWPVGIGKPEEVAEDLLKGMRAGYKAVKMKVGNNDQQDIEMVKAVREAGGPDLKIIVDANQAYDVKSAIRIIRQIEKYDIQRVEQPVHYKDLDGLALVRRSVEVPIGACECAVTPQDVIQIIKKDAADFLNFKVMRSGGFYPGKAIVQMATAAGIFCAGSRLPATAGSTAAHAAAVLKKTGCKKIGLCGLKTMLAEFYVQLTAALPEVEFVDASDLLDEVRMIKSEEELGLIRNSAKLSDCAFQKFTTMVGAGRTEADAFVETDYVLKKLGAETTYFMTSADPHPVTKFIDLACDTYEVGDLILFNVEVQGPGGYYTQLQRTVSIGQPTKEAQVAYAVCMKAFDAAVAMFRPGVKVSGIYQTNPGDDRAVGAQDGPAPGPFPGSRHFRASPDCT